MAKRSTDDTRAADTRAGGFNPQVNLLVNDREGYEKHPV